MILRDNREVEIGDESDSDEMSELEDDGMEYPVEGEALFARHALNAQIKVMIRDRILLRTEGMMRTVGQDSLHILVGPIIRSRAKKIKDVIKVLFIIIFPSSGASVDEQAIVREVLEERRRHIRVVRLVLKDITLSLDSTGASNGPRLANQFSNAVHSDDSQFAMYDG
ncbi:hypothetical protein Adt_18546 [Abeliophyllum distichum]|uniref:Uncharacterized protein n=1 Tax=Abeliophyllum distichum TaxID=126358 RepID=A0ABD1TJQ3_9LAMI